MATLAPGTVLVSHETDFELLIARHATRDQIRFFLKTRGQDIVNSQFRVAGGCPRWCRRWRGNASAWCRDNLLAATGSAH